MFFFVSFKMQDAEVTVIGHKESGKEERDPAVFTKNYADGGACFSLPVAIAAGRWSPGDTYGDVKRLTGKLFISLLKSTYILQLLNYFQS
jgi:hypothetical protein